MAEENQEVHEELAEILDDKPELDLNGEVKADLNSVPEEKGEPEPEVEAKAETEETPEPDKPDTEVPPTSDDDFQAKIDAFMAKAEDEKGKRQSLETEIGTLRNQLAQMQAANTPKIDPLEDPEGYRQQQEDAIAQRELASRTAMSEMVLKLQHEDYDEVVSVFADAARQNPALAQQLAQAEIPAQFAYNEGKRLKSVKEIGDDPEAFKATLKEQIRSEIMAELGATTAKGKTTEKKEALPETIANAGGGSPLAGQTEPADDLATLLGETE